MICFVSKSDVCNFADNNAISLFRKILDDILHNLKFDLGHISKWFKVNSLKPNPVEFQFMILGTNTDKIILFLDRNKTEKSQKSVLIQITIDHKLSFKTHIESFCGTGKDKLHALQRIRKYLGTDKANKLCPAFTSSQFYYAPLIWMFDTTYDTAYDTTYDELLSINSDISIHQSHLHFPVTEVFK